MSKDYKGPNRRKCRRNGENGFKKWARDYGFIALAAAFGLWCGVLQANQVNAADAREKTEAKVTEIQKLQRDQARFNGSIEKSMKVQESQNRMILQILLQDPQAAKDFIEKARRTPQ